MPARLQFYLPLVLAVLTAAAVAQIAARDPRSMAPLLVLGALLSVPTVIGRWRLRKLLKSGDVERVIGAWEGPLRRAPHRDTMAPLLHATAYAAYGWLDAGRTALARSVRGPAWEAALEQRLFVETLLDAFEGDREAALRKAAALEALPLPAASLLARRRVALLRRGLGALARAFAHSSREGDARALARTAATSPLVHWAMRYAAAIVALDHGRAREVPLLLSGAPSWPDQSAFHAYHNELLERAVVLGV